MDIKKYNFLYHGRCEDILPKIDSKSVDLILADLPYNTTRAKWDEPIDLKLLWEQYKRIIKNYWPKNYKKSESQRKIKIKK